MNEKNHTDNFSSLDTISTPKVLVTDDDEATRILLRAAITPWGYKVIEARDGEEAWEILQKPDPPQILILDWLMPKLDGVSLCRRINQKLYFHPYIIFLTRMTGTENVIHGLEAGADEFMLKPFDLSELRIRIYAGERINRYRNQIAELKKELATESAGLQKVADEHVKLVTALSDLEDILEKLDTLLPDVTQSVEKNENREMLLKVTDNLKNKIKQLHAQFKSYPIFSFSLRRINEAKQEKLAMITPAAKIHLAKKNTLIDSDRLHDFFGDNVEALQEFIQTFITLGFQHLEKIHLAIESKDSENARYYFHLLGSASGNTGIMKMYDLCGEGEKNIREGDWQSVQQVYQDLLQMMEKLRKEVL